MLGSRFSRCCVPPETVFGRNSYFRDFISIESTIKLNVTFNMSVNDQTVHNSFLEFNGNYLFTILLVFFASIFYFAAQNKKSVDKDVKDKNHSQPVVSQKTQNKKKKGLSSSKENRKPFTHHLLKKTLKGHGNKILDMDVSSNGKLLATCSEDTAMTGLKHVSNLKTAPNSSNKKEDFTTESEDNDSDDVEKPIEKNNNIAFKCTKQYPVFTKYCQKLKRKYSVFHKLLNQYILSAEHLVILGYPCKVGFDSTEIVIIKPPEFSDSFHSLGKVHIRNEKMACCARCRKDFAIGHSNPYPIRKCTYHWGKITKDVDNRSVYLCCHSSIGSKGCEISDYHVWSGLQPGINGPFYDYITFQSNYSSKDLEIFGLDCEMCYTANGLELSRVTLVNIDGELIYDEYVKLDQVIDFNTRYSGITKEHLQNATKSLKDVQKDLMQIVSAESVLVGHGLNNDLRALKIYHTKVVDTCVLFPHYYGLPYRRSLRSLVSSILNRNIQIDSSGHDSVEDARASLELLLWKVTKDVDYISR